MIHKEIAGQKFSFEFIPFQESIEIEDPSNLFSQNTFLNHTNLINTHIQHELIEIKNEGKKVGKLYFQIMPFKGRELKSYIPRGEECMFNKTLEAIVDMALERVNWKLAVLGNIFITGDNGQYWEKETNQIDKWALVKTAANLIADHTKIDAFLVSDLRSEDLLEHDTMIKDNYRLLEVEPDLIINIDEEWNSFDDYLTSVISKYRVRTKKVLKNSSAIKIKDLSYEEIKASEIEIHKLYKNVVEQAAFKLAEISPNYFHSFKKAYPDQFYVRGFYLEEKLVGVISFFSNEDSLHINFVGLAYEYNKEYSIYQRILYDCIEQGILLKKTNVHFGRTASEIKTSVGAKPVKAFSMLKHNSKIPNLAIKPLTNYLKPEPFEVRNPFKTKKIV